MKKVHFLVLSVLLNALILVGAFSLLNAHAAPLLVSRVPTVVSYQGVVKNSGSPYTGVGFFKFAVVDSSGEITYWSNDGTAGGGEEPTNAIELIVANGLFHVLLGDTDLDHMTALPASTFSGPERYLRIWFSSDAISYTLLTPDQRIASVPYALQAEEAMHAENADTLDGLDSTDLYTKAEVDTLLAGLEDRIIDLETTLASVSVGGNNLYFTGVNVHIRNGNGATDSDLNGLGNLIIGYHADDGGDAIRSGSHNLIVGDEHSYTSYGGLLAGYNNTISGPYSTVSGGYLNTASGERSSISGGGMNSAGGYASSLGGGTNNTASGSYSSVSGGRYNLASGNWTAVLGGGGENSGEGNEAYALYSVIAGGRSNIAGDDSGPDRTVGEASAVLSGYWNQAVGDFAAVSSGWGNNASGDYSSVSGGDGNIASGSISSISGGAGNTASGWISSISGGHSNTTSGNYSSVSGGRNNIASGASSSVLGGGGLSISWGNEAWADYSVVAGGRSNIAGDVSTTFRIDGEGSVVLAGQSNRAEGNFSAVCGGSSNIASGSHSSVSAGYDNEASGAYSSVYGFFSQYVTTTYGYLP